MQDAPGARILVVDDEALIRKSLAQTLRSAGHVVEEAGTAAAAKAAFEREAPDLLLLDYKLPDRTGVDLMGDVRRVLPQVPVIMITAHASLRGAVEATKEGVFDYIGKPFELEELMHSVERALDASRLRDQVAWQRGAALRGCRLEDVVCESPTMAEVVSIVRRIAESEAGTVLLLGESGVGKGLVARALHNAGRTRGEAFMDIACTALPDSLLESELFGHEKGAFTDAKTQKRGLLELADGGTVFLDEIGDISPELQAKLLRFLEERDFRRVGGTRDIRVSVRVIAATNKDLAQEVAAGRFRKDLFYRLKVIPIEIPPLRRRPEDLMRLADMFVGHFNVEFRKRVTGFDPEAEAAMRAYPWPGNVREMRNAIERAVLLGGGDVLGLRDLPPEIEGSDVPLPAEDDETPGLELPPEGVVLERLEREFVRQALLRTDGNRARAARLLGINRDQMRYRIKKFQLTEFSSADDGDGAARG